MSKTNNFPKERALFVNCQGVLVEGFSQKYFAEVDGIMYNPLSDELEFYHNISDPDV